MTRPSRRQYLAAVGTVGLSGCTLLDPEDGAAPPESPSTPQPPDEPTSRSTPTPASGAAAADVHVATDYASEAWVARWRTDVVPGFEERHGRSVAMDYAIRPSQMVGRVEELVEAGNPPEVYHVDLATAIRHVARGHTRPVDGLLADLVDANGALVGEHSIRSGGTAHLVPHGLYLGGVLHYRADVYEDLGLSVPGTWEELVENARAIDESERVDARGFAVPAGPYDGKPHDDFTNWLYAAGGDYWRWADGPGGRVELDFRAEQVRAALELMGTLARYSPDPAETGYPSTAQAWVLGEVAQCFWPNAWLAGIAYGVSSDEPGPRTVALNTRQAPVPLRDATLDPPTRGWAYVDGSPLFDGANVEAAEAFLRYAYEGPSRQARMNNVAMKTVPPYADVIDAEAYRRAEVYRAEDGLFLDLERGLLEEIAPGLDGERPRTPAARYATGAVPGEHSAVTEMVRAVLVDGRPVDDAIDRARRRLGSRLEEGRKLGSG